jgi:hypothetical protein
MSSVDKVIFDALAKRQNVVLPDVGSLEVKRRPAKKLSEDRIIPPQNVVVFTTDEIAEGESVVSLLASTGEYNTDEVENVYRSWLDGASLDEGIEIEGVGDIRGGKFIVASALHGELNPADNEIVIERERNLGPLWAWILGGVLLAILILGGFMCCKHGCFDCKKDKQVETVQTAIIEEPATPEEPAVVAETESNDAVAQAQASTPAPVPAETRYHIIAGSFSIEKNADDFAKKLQKMHPELTIEKLPNPTNGYTMVSILQFPTDRQAYNKISYYWDIDLNIWVYKEN